MTRRILIVDDEPNIVISLEYLMRREGYEVVVAGDGEAALEAAGAAPPPDLVVLDVMLPKLSGFEVCRRMRADPRLKGLRILMLTARGGEAEVTVAAHDPGPDAPDMGWFETLGQILAEMDPASRAIPIVVPGVTDARFLSRLGIQTENALELIRAASTTSNIILEGVFTHFAKADEAKGDHRRREQLASDELDWRDAGLSEQVEIAALDTHHDAR